MHWVLNMWWPRLTWSSTGGVGFVASSFLFGLDTSPNEKKACARFTLTAEACKERVGFSPALFISCSMMLNC